MYQYIIKTYSISSLVSTCILCMDDTNRSQNIVVETSAGENHGDPSCHSYAFLFFAAAIRAIGFALHFTNPSTMAEVYVNTLSLVPTSMAVWVACSSVLVRFQTSQLEFLGGLFHSFSETFPEWTLVTLTEGVIWLCMYSLFAIAAWFYRK
jgi:hypothetical protein